MIITYAAAKIHSLHISSSIKSQAEIQCLDVLRQNYDEKNVQRTTFDVLAIKIQTRKTNSYSIQPPPPPPLASQRIKLML